MAPETRSLDAAVLAPAVARWQREPQRAAAGLAVARLDPALAQEAELVFGHRPFQPQQEPIVDEARIVDPVGIDHQRRGEGAEVDQVVPVAPVAGEARRLDAEHRADLARADCRHEPLEPRAFTDARSRPAQVLVDDGDRPEAGGTRLVGQRVLPALAFRVAHHLRHGGLADIDDGTAGQVVSVDPAAHGRLPPRGDADLGRGLPEAGRPEPAPPPPEPAPTGAVALDRDRATAGFSGTDDSASEASSTGRAFDDARPRCPSAVTLRSAARRPSASVTTRGGPSSAIPMQAAASHIHAGTTRLRPGCSSSQYRSSPPLVKR